MQDKKTWERSPKEQKRSRAERANRRNPSTPIAARDNVGEENPEIQGAPKKGKMDETIYGRLHFYSVHESESHEGWESPLPAKQSLTNRIEQAHQDDLQQAHIEFPPLATPPSVGGYLARPGTPHFTDRNVTSPLTPFQSTRGALLQFNAQPSPAKPDVCVTAIRNVRAFIEKAMENQSFDCDAALELLNNERDNVLNAMDDLDADDLNSREVHSEVIANFVFMIQRINDRQAQQQAVSPQDVREFMHAMEPQRQEVVAKLF